MERLAFASRPVEMHGGNALAEPFPVNSVPIELIACSVKQQDQNALRYRCPHALPTNVQHCLPCLPPTPTHPTPGNPLHPDVEPAAGGETALPLAYPLDRELQSLEGRGFSECAAQMGLSVRPRKGDVLLFWDMDLDGTPDRHALHASCPTTNGTKWTATKWIHNVRYNV